MLAHMMANTQGKYPIYIGALKHMCDQTSLALKR